MFSGSVDGGAEMNRPEWKDAPEWVMWIAQDKSGIWFGYDNKPDLLAEEWGRIGATRFDDFGSCILLERGKQSRKWRNTLESRP